MQVCDCGVCCSGLTSIIFCSMAVLIGEAKEAADDAADIRGGDAQIGEMEGEAISYNDYFNDSSDQGSYVESTSEEDSVDSVSPPTQRVLSSAVTIQERAEKAQSVHAAHRVTISLL